MIRKFVEQKFIKKYSTLFPEGLNDDLHVKKHQYITLPFINHRHPYNLHCLTRNKIIAYKHNANLVRRFHSNKFI